MATAYDPAVSDDRGPLIIRPSWRAFGQWGMRFVAVLILAMVVGAVRLSRYGIGWVVAMLVIVGVILCGYALYMAAYMLGTRITVTANAILVTHWFRSTAAVAPSDIARVVRISVRGGTRDLVGRQAVFGFSANRRCVLSLYAERWSKDDLDRIWRHLGVQAEGSWDRTILEKDLPIEFPGAF